MNWFLMHSIQHPGTFWEPLLAEQKKNAIIIIIIDMHAHTHLHTYRHACEQADTHHTHILTLEKLPHHYNFIFYFIIIIIIFKFILFLLFFFF